MYYIPKFTTCFYLPKYSASIHICWHLDFTLWQAGHRGTCLWGGLVAFTHIC